MASRFRSEHDREIRRLALPALGALVAEPLYVLADTAVVGRIGTQELAGLAIASSALLSGFAIFIFLAYGTTAAVSRLLGAGDERSAANEAVQGLWLAAGIGVIVAATGAIWADPILRALGGDGVVLEQATIYFRISLIGVPAQLLLFAGTGYLRGLQDTRTPLLVAVAAAVANLVLELVLIVGLDFGIGASALSTVVAQVGSGLVYVAVVVRATRVHGASFAPHLRSIARLAKVGGDLLVRTIALRGSLTFATAIAARIGTVDVAAHEIAFAVWSLLALGLDAVAIAAQAMIGRFLGADDPDGAKQVGHRLLQLGVAGGAAVGVLVLAASPFLPHAFSADPEVVGLAAFLLLHVAWLQPVNGLVFVLDGLLIGAGDMAFLAKAMIVAAIAFAVPGAYVLAFDLGIGWLWGAIAVFMCARAAVLLRRWRSDAWIVLGARA